MDAYELTNYLPPETFGDLSKIASIRHKAKLLTGPYRWLLFVEQPEDDLEELFSAIDQVREAIGPGTSSGGVALGYGPRPGGGGPLGPTRWFKATPWLAYCTVNVSPGHAAEDVLQRIGDDHERNGYQGGAIVAGDFDILIELGFESRPELSAKAEAVRSVGGVDRVVPYLSPYQPQG